MKTANCIKSMVFLFAILFSFSVSAYNSLNELSASHIASLKKINVDKTSNNNAVTDNIIFEELENENSNESSLAQAFFLLPFYYQAFNATILYTPSATSSPLVQIIEPIFLSIRVLRI
ncbi:MAG: hypothetical protein ACXVNM_15180 [Bacteroidia bacterium]